MKKTQLVFLCALSAAGCILLVCCMDKPEMRVARELQEKRVVHRSDDLKLIAKSSDLRENAFLFELNSTHLNIRENDKIPLSIRGANQSNSKRSLEFVAATLERRINIHFDKRGWSVWEIATTSDHVFLIEEGNKYYLLVSYI